MMGSPSPSAPGPLLGAWSCVCLGPRGEREGSWVCSAFCSVRKPREMPTVWLEREAGGVIKGPGS